jgi:signal transduction histidine kinase
MSTRKTALLGLAFAALLLVAGGSAYAVWRIAAVTQDRISELHSAHVGAGDALASIRANVYLSGILTRDYLLDPVPSHAVHYIEQFQEIRAGTERSFRVLEVSGHDAGWIEAIAKLRRELDLYWDPTEMALDWSPEEKQAQRAGLLRQRVRRRQDIFALAAQVQQLMTANFQRERQRLTTADQELRSSVLWTAGVALLLSLGIAGLTLMRMVSLEKQSEEAESELRRLSGQLRTAQEQERKFLSRELHDQVGQMLTGLRMELTGMARLHGDAASELSARIARAKGTVEQTLRIVRNIAMLIRPSMLDDLGLTPALAWLIKEMSRSSGMEIRSHIDPAVDSLPDSHRTCIYRVVQEALTNCSRHSAATEVEVAVTAQEGWVTCTVADNGRGFDGVRARGAGLGLLAMEERVRELGGALRIQSAPGQGARLEIRLPLPQGVMGDSSPDRGRSRDRSDRIETTA